MKELTKDLKDRGAKVGVRKVPGDNPKPEEVDLAKKATFMLGIDKDDAEALKLILGLASLVLFAFFVAGLAVRIFFLASGGGPVPWGQ